jgi:alpha-L-fucosidase
MVYLEKMKQLNLLILFIIINCLSSRGLSQYTPDWTSLDKRKLPSWYDESKIGIFIHWFI